ncbi:MAG: hypothetical protein ACI4TK_06825 [Agathobacter sp.]
MKCLVFTILVTIVLSSCSHKNEAIELTRSFFISLSDSKYGSPTDFYPQYDSLKIVVKSDVVDIEESDITEKNDSIIVRCINNYTDAKGTFRQDSVLMFITKDKNSEWYIYDSRGLISIDKDIELFGNDTGAFGKKPINDLQLTEVLGNLYDLLKEKYWEKYIELKSQVEVLDWSWETSYDGTAHGEACIMNKLPYSVSGIKYHVTYYDRQHNFMAEDDGNISKKLNPEERYNFTFWSSNAKYPSRAKLSLDFSDRVIYDLLKYDFYSGTEYQEYVNKIKSE